MRPSLVFAEQRLYRSCFLVEKLKAADPVESVTPRARLRLRESNTETVKPLNLAVDLKVARPRDLAERSEILHWILRALAPRVAEIATTKLAATNRGGVKVEVGVAVTVAMGGWVGCAGAGISIVGAIVGETVGAIEGVAVGIIVGALLAVAVAVAVLVGVLVGVTVL